MKTALPFQGGLSGLLLAGWALFAWIRVDAASFDPSGNLLRYEAPGAVGPKIIRSPHDRLSRPGVSVSFSVTASGYPLRYQWFFNNAALVGKTNDTLWLPKIDGSAFGNYLATVSDGSLTVTSSVARLDLDLDGDGLSDTWEVTYFGSITNQNAAMDADSDGTSNGKEFLDGTTPSSATSLRPRLQLYSVGGRIQVTPDKDSYTTNDLVALTAVLEPGEELLTWSGDLSGNTNPAPLQMLGNRSVQATIGRPLGEALGITNRLTTGGWGGWYGESEVTHDGLLAAASAPALAPPKQGNSSWMQTDVTLTKDGLISFWWKLDGNGANRLTFRIDGNNDFSATRTLDGRTGWIQKRTFLSAGTHRIRWEYLRESDYYYTPDSGALVPADAGYVDQVQLLDGYDPKIDTDGNGLSDLAEYRYFDQLGNDANADPDGDYVPNSVEIADGTNPNDGTSVLPRVNYSIEGGGSAVTVPSLATYTRGQPITNIASFSPGWSFQAWVGPFNSSFNNLKALTNNPAPDTLPVAKTYRVIFGLPIAEAVDSTGLTWKSGGALPWYGQTNQFFQGGDAARSGPTVNGNDESWMETTVIGPGTLEFWWQVNSVTNVDVLLLSLNGTEISRISGTTPWQPETKLLGTGPQTVRWSFKRNYGYDLESANSAWVDAVRFTSGATPPRVSLLSEGATFYQGTDVEMRFLASGTPPIQFQLLRNEQPFGATVPQSPLWISNIAPTLAGSWKVKAFNSAGSSTSAPIVLNVLPIPPVNDNFAAATLLTAPLPITARGYTVGGTKESAESDHSNNTPLHSVWYRWTAPASGKHRLTVTSVEPEAGLIAAVVKGSSLASSVELAGDEDSGTTENGTNIVRIRLFFDAVVGTSYSFVIDSSYGTGDSFDLLLEPVPPPVNDAFSKRFPITGTFVTVSGDTRTATREPGEPNLGGFPFSFASNSVWWVWTAPSSGSVEIKAEGSGFFPVVSVFTGATLPTLKELGNSLFSTTQSVPFDAVAGTAYPISVSAVEKAGEFTLIVAMKAASLSAERRASDGKLIITVRAPAGSHVTLERSTDLDVWAPATDATVPTTGQWQIIDPPGTTLSEQFYRAVVD